jgi:hypothetical protein
MTNPAKKSSIGVVAALSIGVGAMVGADTLEPRDPVAPARSSVSMG